MSTIIAKAPAEERAFDPAASTIDLTFSIVPNNNPEHPNGFAVLFRPERRIKRDRKGAYHGSHMSKDEAREYAMAEIDDECSRYIGDWNIKVH